MKVGRETKDVPVSRRHESITRVILKREVNALANIIDPGVGREEPENRKPNDLHPRIPVPGPTQDVHDDSHLAGDEEVQGVLDEECNYDEYGAKLESIISDWPDVRPKDLEHE